MAGMAVSPLINRLISLLKEEAELLGGFHSGVTEIKDELESIQSFLKDADARVAAEGDNSEGVKTWVKQVREVAFLIDVAIDEYLLHMAQHPPRPGFFGFLHKIAFLPKTLKPRHKIAAEIMEIKASVQKIKERSERYRFQTAGQGSSSSAQNVKWNDPRNNSLYLADADVVGIEVPRKKLIGLLVEEQPRRTVLSVVGMGGLGKTTLAKKVYDDQTVRGHFNCHAWIPVSQSYNVEDLLRSMIEEFCKARKELPPKEMDSRDKIIIKAREYLQDKRYVVVFDDVWKNDFWGEIEHALPDNEKGGRIMITTRHWEVANFCKRSSLVHVHVLEQLPTAKAWELFCKKAFHYDFTQHCPPELKKLSLDIVEKCNGSPLAIVAIGGLLATKEKSIIEWENFLGNLGGELEKNLHLKGVKNILSLSYEDLPYNLKSCFLYLGMYPNGCSINCVSLIRQWIAEGFVEKIENKTSEEVARQYLIELIHRSLVQVAEFNFDGKVRRC
ncbi:disease resistance protein RPM1-like [Fagus crenata]